ncbi:MAG: hypothetical protein ACYDEP_02425 [Acidimicrobiales bacterium]
MAQTGAYGRSVAGDHGVAISGHLGTSIAGDSGIASAGHFGYAVAGRRGTAIAGLFGTAIADVGGVAQAGVGGTITIAGQDESGTRYVVTAEIDSKVGPSPNILYGLRDHRLVVAPPPEPLDNRQPLAAVS